MKKDIWQKNFELLDEEEEEWFKEYNLLTAKPVIYAANVSEDDLADDGASNEQVAKVREFAKKRKNQKCLLSVRRLSRRLRNWMTMRRRCFWRIWDFTESGLEKLIRASYRILGLISF